MKTLHFVYVRGDSTAAPMSITNHVATALRSWYDVREYDWLDDITIIPQPGDLLLGHPHPAKNTVLQRSFFNPLFNKRVVMCPLAHAMPEYISFLDPFIEQCDTYLAITAEHWMRTLPESIVSHWSDKVVHLDLAVDADHFLPLDRTWNPTNRRKFLFIGSTGKNKGSDLIGALADRNPHQQFGWIGHGSIASKRLVRHGPQDLSSDNGRAVLSEYDFLLHMGRSDANPTTILEALAWGLLPVCTPQCGYEQKPWLFSVPLQLEGTEHVLHSLQNIPAEDLSRKLALGRAALLEHYNWHRFTEQVRSALESPRRLLSDQNKSLFAQRRDMLARMTNTKQAHDRLVQLRERFVRCTSRAIRKGAELWR